MTGVTVLPAAREKGQAVNMARCTCPTTQDTERQRERARQEKGDDGNREGGRGGKMRADNERVTSERRHLQKTINYTQ